MRDIAYDGAGSPAPEPGTPEAAAYYAKEFWAEENLKFAEPWYRLEKSAKLIAGLAAGQRCTLLDVGCGPAALRKVLPANIEYYGIDIAIHDPAPYLLEADILAAPIAFADQRFDFVVAHGLFEYVGDRQGEKFAEIAGLLEPSGRFIVTYTNFGHRRAYIYPPFSNVQPLDEFREALEHSFRIERTMPVAHNWKHKHPGRRIVKAANMRLSANIPIVSRALAVEYSFVCRRR